MYIFFRVHLLQAHQEARREREKESREKEKTRKEEDKITFSSAYSESEAFLNIFWIRSTVTKIFIPDK